MYAAGWRAEGGIASMTIEIHEQTLWLIPVILAVGFMVWVLWNWWREEHHMADRRIEDRRIEDPRIEARHERVFNLSAPTAPSSEARDWHRRGRLILH
jgi:hypothetical protein